MSDEVEFYEVPIRSWEDLLRVTSSTTTNDVERFMIGDLDSHVSIGEVTDEGVEFILDSYGRGVVEPFPFTIGEVWSDLEDLEADEWMPALIEEFEETIAEVEGFEVSIDVDESITDPALLTSLGRYQTTNGTLVQNSWKWRGWYTTRAPGTMTVEEWLERRFFRRLPGYRVSLHGTKASTLRELRDLTGQSTPTSYSTKPNNKTKP